MIIIITIIFHLYFVLHLEDQGVTLKIDLIKKNKKIELDPLICDMYGIEFCEPFSNNVCL